MEQQQQQQSIVAMMPSPGMGHLIPMIEFAKRLVLHHNLSVTFIIPTDAPPSNAQITVLRSLPPAISHTFLPPVTLSDLPLHTKFETFISHMYTVLRSLPSLRHALLSQSSTVTALIADIFGTDSFDIANELNIPSYVFFPSTAMSLSFSFYLSQHLHQNVKCEFRNLFMEKIYWTRFRIGLTMLTSGSSTTQAGTSWHMGS